MNNHMAYLKEGYQEPTEGIEIFKNNVVQIKEGYVMDFMQKIKAAVELYAHRMVSSTMQYSEEVRQDSSLKGKTKALITLDRLQKNALELFQYDKDAYKKEQEEKLKSEKLQKTPKSVWFSGKNTEKSFF